jgi:hypothetical protein
MQICGGIEIKIRRVRLNVLNDRQKFFYLPSGISAVFHLPIPLSLGMCTATCAVVLS